MRVMISWLLSCATYTLASREPIHPAPSRNGRDGPDGRAGSVLGPGTKAPNVMNESAAAGVTTKSQLENYYRWVEPDVDITVCLEFETVDRLQLEVLCGIHSFSDAGNEVGGILLGRT